MSEENLYSDIDHNRLLLDELLRAGVPEIKLALGEAIDRENARPLPPRYARLLPETLLVVTLRPDAAAALAPIALDIERELTDSCNRHGSLYDRTYRVKLQRSENGDAPLYTVTAHAGQDVGRQTSVPVPASTTRRTGSISEIPPSDPDATGIVQVATPGWEPGRWLLVVEDLDGGEREVFRLTDPQIVVGRRTDDPELRATIAISDAPHVSRRQLALVWEEREGAAGFRIFNLGLNDVHLPARDIPGARARRSIDLDSIEERHTGWLPPGIPLRIGEHGPQLRIEEVPEASDEEWIDPDATVFE